MSQYSDQQIKQFIDEKGIAGDPFAMYNYAQKFGVSPGDIDRVMGYGSGTSDRWIEQQGLKGLDGSAYGGAARSTAPVTDQQIQQFAQKQGIAGNPQALQAFSQQYGIQPGQIDSAMGYSPGAAAGWQQQQGFASAPTAPQPSNPFLPGGAPGGMTLAPNPPGGYNTSTGTQQPGMPSMGAYQPNAGGNPLVPMASGGAGGRPMTGAQGWQQSPQVGNPFLSGGQGRQQGGFAPPWDNANPNTQWMAGQMAQGVTDHLQRNLMPGIRSAASMAGGLGGSRQGIAEGIAVGDAAKGLSTSLAGLYGGQYNQDRNYGLQSDALDLNVYNTNQNWMRQGQQDQIGLANTMLGWQGQGLNTATQAQNTPLNYFSQFTNLGTQLGGMGGTNSQTMQGNPLLGAIGGAMTGYNLYNGWNKPAGS